MKKIIIFVISLLIVTGLLVIPVQSGFLVTDGNGNPFLFHPDKTKEIGIGWRHSVELTPWKEIYQVKETGEFTLLSTSYKSYGAGTPDVEGKAEILSNGFIQVTGIERIIPYYSLFYIPISQYFIEIAGNEYALADFVPEYTNVQIHYKTVRLYEWIWLKLTFLRWGGME